MHRRNSNGQPQPAGQPVYPGQPAAPQPQAAPPQYQPAPAPQPQHPPQGAPAYVPPQHPQVAAGPASTADAPPAWVGRVAQGNAANLTQRNGWFPWAQATYTCSVRRTKSQTRRKDNADFFVVELEVLAVYGGDGTIQPGVVRDHMIKVNTDNGPANIQNFLCSAAPHLVVDLLDDKGAPMKGVAGENIALAAVGQLQDIIGTQVSLTTTPIHTKDSGREFTVHHYEPLVPEQA